MNIKKLQDLNNVVEDKLDKDVDNFTLENIQKIYSNIDKKVNAYSTIEGKNIYLAYKVIEYYKKISNLNDIIDETSEKSENLLKLSSIFLVVFVLGILIGLYNFLVILLGISCFFTIGVGLINKIIETISLAKNNKNDALGKYYINLFLASIIDINKKDNEKNPQLQEEDTLTKIYELQNGNLYLNYIDDVFNLNVYPKEEIKKLTRSHKNNKM